MEERPERTADRISAERVSSFAKSVESQMAAVYKSGRGRVKVKGKEG